MKTIVALIDFSDLTFKVLKQVHALAKAFTSQVQILHVTTKQPVVVDVGLISPTVMQEPSPEQERAEAVRLQEIHDSLAKFGVESSIQQIHARDVDQLLVEARKHNPDLVVVGSHQHGTLFEIFRSSVSAQVLRHASCPVLVVPSQSNLHSEPGMKTILALVDFSDVTTRVLQYTEALANAFGSQVVLAHIVPPEPVVVDFAPPTPLAEFDNGRERLDGLRDLLASRGLTVGTHSTQGPVVATIRDWMDQHRPDCIVMGSHGHGALYNLLVGSVTAGVLKGADCPVFVVPSAGDAAA